VELGQRRAMKSVFIKNAGPSSALLAAFFALTACSLKWLDNKRDIVTRWLQLLQREFRR
jgi:hypothetical protein